MLLPSGKTVETQPGAWFITVRVPLFILSMEPPWALTVIMSGRPSMIFRFVRVTTTAAAFRLTLTLPRVTTKCLPSRLFAPHCKRLPGWETKLTHTAVQVSKKAQIKFSSAGKVS